MIYLLDKMEFQVLAAARNVGAYYGFADMGQAAEGEIPLAVYRLLRAGILKQQEEALVIQEPVAGCLDGMASAAGLIVIDRGGYVLPRQCVYYSGQEKGQAPYVCLENSPSDPGQLCLSAFSEEQLKEQLGDLNQLPQPRLAEGLGGFDFDAYWNRHLDAGTWKLLCRGLAAETEDLLGCGQVQTVFSAREKETGRLCRRMILLDFPLEYCMAVQQGDTLVEMEQYSRETAWEYLKNWWRECR